MNVHPSLHAAAGALHHWPRRLTGPAAGLLAAGLMVLPLSPAAAATITVATTEPADPVACTLADAIRAANTDAAVGGCDAGSSADLVVLPAGGRFRFLEALDGNGHALPAIASEIAIDGNGAILERPAEAASLFRLLSVEAGGVLDLRDTTVQGGRALDNGGGLHTAGRLTLTRSQVLGNRTADVSSGSQILNCGGGVYVDQGAALAVVDSTLAGNAAALGGGICAFRGTVDLGGSTLSGNRASRGGALFSAALIAPTPTVSVRNSTLSGNTALLSGGGVDVFSGRLRIASSTLAGNVASSGNAIAAVPTRFVAVELGAALVAGNGSDGDELSLLPQDPPDEAFVQPYASLGDNLIGRLADDLAGRFTAEGDQVRVADPKLAELADKGGATQTHALLAGSPALDAVTAAGNCAATDQRGITRPQGPACDIGAFEAETDPAPQARADLSLSKTTALTVTVGDPLPYTLTVSNAGPDLATGVQVVDALPVGVSFVSAAPIAPAIGSCQFALDSVICDLGELANGASAGVLISTTANTPGTIVNTASVIGTKQDDNPQNNAGSASVLIAPRDPDPAPDADGDGIEDGHDVCATTPTGALVNSRGCGLDQLAPCEGPFGSDQPWRRHGDYVAAYRTAADSFVAEGLITTQQRRQLVADATRSSCGR